MPLHDQVTPERVLANKPSDAASLNERIGAVNQDLGNWQLFLDVQCKRIGPSIFTTKYHAFEKIMLRIDDMLLDLQRPSQLDAQQVDEYEKRAIEIYESILSAIQMHRDKGMKGAVKITFCRQPQSAQDFAVFSPPSYLRR